jgi:hypothetical protein
MRDGNSRKRAIADALFRLGMHARAEAVVRALAEQGIRASAGLVALVRLELLKKHTQPSSASRSPRAAPAVRRFPRGFPRRGKHGKGS